jgi:hypothetical protein
MDCMFFLLFWYVLHNLGFCFGEHLMLSVVSLRSKSKVCHRGQVPVFSLVKPESVPKAVNLCA